MSAAAAPAPTPTTPQPPSTIAANPRRTRFDIWSLRRNRKLKGQGMIRAIYNYILTRETQRDGGGLILSLPERRCYLRSGLTSRLYEISIKNKEFTAYLFYRYRLLETESITRHVIVALEAACRLRGRERATRRFLYFDRRDDTLYISRYDGTCWRLNGESVESAPNGAGYALFLDDDEGKPVREPIVGNHGKLIPFLIEGVQFVESTQGGMTKGQQRLALGVWLFAIAFPDLLPAKPMLLIEGAMGSGKSVLVQLIQRVVHGKQKTHPVGKNDEQDFGVHILRSPICLLDNMDSFVDWVQNALAIFTTGDGWTRRKLFTDDEQVKIDPQSFLAITSRNPLSFKRDDIADRCIILRLDRRTSNRPLSLLHKQIEDDRDSLFGEWLWFLNRIIKEIRAGTLLKNAEASQHRLADFTALALTVGKVLHVPAADVDAMLVAMQSERDALITEGDPLIDFLDRWLENAENVGKKVTAADLHRELSTLAKAANRSFYKTPSTLGQKLRAEPLRQQFDVRIVGTRGNAKVYEFRRLRKDR